VVRVSIQGGEDLPWQVEEGGYEMGSLKGTGGGSGHHQFSQHPGN